MISVISERTYSAKTLIEKFPSIWHPKKQLIFDISDRAHKKYSGQLDFKRWQVQHLPRSTQSATKIDISGRENVYDYLPDSDNQHMSEWHVNFAHPDLFAFYGSQLMAQDEIQVAEHPVLGSLREALIKDASPSITHTVEKNMPTPITITNVERRCVVQTDKNIDEGRPYNLYGSEFSRADDSVISNAVTPLNPTTMTNLIAIAAPAYGSGTYTKSDINYILQTAYAGFAAAIHETNRLYKPQHHVRIHTGFWGCGAFGGSRFMMVILQTFAMKLAGIHSGIFHTVDRSGTKIYQEAKFLIESHMDDPSEIFIDWIYSLEFQWGKSDGN